VPQTLVKNRKAYVVEALRGTELFAEATHEELGTIAPAVRRRAFARGAHVYHAGEPAAAAYVVLSGLLKTVTVGPAGHELIVELTGPGGCIGEFHLLEEDSRRYYDLVAVERSECLVMSRVSLQYYLERNPRLMRKVAAAMVRRLMRQADTHHIGPRTESGIAGRLERQLSALSDAYGEDTAEGRRIRLHLGPVDAGGAGRCEPCESEPGASAAGTQWGNQLRCRPDRCPERRSSALQFVSGAAR
jgi:CRP/FNR family transcriptional regulator, nitrogen oxide reductase regulator